MCVWGGHVPRADIGSIYRVDLWGELQLWGRLPFLPHRKTQNLVRKVGLAMCIGVEEFTASNEGVKLRRVQPAALLL